MTTTQPPLATGPTLAPQRIVEHSITINAPAEEVYRLIAEVENWPRIFPPTVYVTRVQDSIDELGRQHEQIRIWASANGEPKSWTSRRTLSPRDRRIEFRQEVSAPPVGAMGGSWIVEQPAGDATSCRVRLLHDYRAVDDDPEKLAWIDAAVDRNSESELAALKANVEIGATSSESAELMFSFADTVDIAGRAEDVYDFLNDAQLWQERLPHVARVALDQPAPDLQVLEMDTRTKDGSMHTTKSIRVCLAGSLIAYKQITLPALMNVHTGYWEIVDHGDGTVSATSQHTVVLKPEAISAVLGEQADIAQARAFVQAALSGNSTATLGYAKKYAEAASAAPRQD